MQKVKFVCVFYAFTAPLALAQEDALATAVKKIQYTPLAAQARIQGDVHLRLGADSVVVVSGDPLLVPGARESAVGLGRFLGSDLEIVYHFVLAEPFSRTKTVTEKKGDPFDRLILRVLRLRTERTLVVEECVSTPANEKNRIDTSKKPIEVWVYGAAHCVQTEAAAIAAR